MQNNQDPRHSSINVTIYFDDELTDEEVTNLVDNLLHNRPRVQDYEFDLHVD